MHLQKPNPNLRAEENRAFEAGIEQNMMAGKYSLSAVYFNNLFQHQIDSAAVMTRFRGQYVNINKSMAHGAEVQPQRTDNVSPVFEWRVSLHIIGDSGTALCIRPIASAGQPLAPASEAFW